MKTKIELNRKQAILITLAVALSMLLVGSGVWYFASAYFEGPESNVPKYLDITFPCSYVVDTNGTHTFMYNATTWKLDAWSDNASLISNWATGNLTDGGSIFYRGGTYNVSYDTDIPYNKIEIWGEGASTMFQVVSDNISVFSCTAQRDWVVIKDITIFNFDRDTQTNVTGIKGIFWKANFHDIEFYDCSAYSIQLTSINSSWQHRSYENYVYQSHFYTRTQKSQVAEAFIYFHSLFSTDNEVRDCVFTGTNRTKKGIWSETSGQEIIGCHIVECQNSIFLESGGLVIQSNRFDTSYHDNIVLQTKPTGSGIHRVSILGNKFFGGNFELNNTYSSIVLNATANDITYCSINDNTFMGNPSSLPKYHILEIEDTGEIDYNEIHDNTFVTGTYGTDVMLLTSTTDIIYGNIGYPNIYSEATYVVFKDGSYTCMQFVETGTVTARSTDANQILNWTVGNCTDGGLIFVKAGDYTEIVNIVLTSGITVRGEGYATHFVLKANAGNETGIFAMQENSSNIVIESLRVDGNRANQEDVGDHERHGIITAYGDITNGASNVTIRSIWAHSWTETAIDTPFSENILIEGCYCWDSTDGGIWVDCCQNNTIVRNNFCWNNSIGIEVQDNWFVGSMSIIDGNAIWDNTDKGIEVLAAKNVIVTKNLVKNTAGSAANILVSNCNQSIISFNIVMDADEDNIKLGDTCWNCTVIGNQVYETSEGFESSRGISVEGHYCIVADNIAVGSFSDTAYQFAEAGNPSNANPLYIHDNQGYNPVGNISTPVQGSYLLDSGNATIANNTQYTCWQSAKVIYISGGTVASVQINGQTVFTATGVTVVLQPSDTFKIVWSSEPTINVMGQ